jgi:hypothetical protein
MKRIGEHWDEYARKIVPPGASVVQVTETRRAFYAGSICLMNEILTVISSGPEPTDDDIAALSSLKDELDAFHRDIKEGRA